MRLIFSILYAILAVVMCLALFQRGAHNGALAVEVRFAAILNQSSDNSTAIILDAIRYSIQQALPIIAPNTMTLEQLLVDPNPNFALQPFSQLFLFTTNPSVVINGAIDGTKDGLAKFFLSNASVR